MNETPAIRILPDHVINQIAAGEVVERPASVMKELLENALDAGATHIEVDVVDGGRRLVRITDDGCGMDRDNALLALERHATSKLRDLKDLDTIATMGFRGEALAAIASVSQFTLITNREHNAVGTEILVFGGRIQDVRDAGAPKGTEVLVRNLFFNVPARRKFLRSASTEFTHIRQTFVLEALANIGVSFVLRADDEEIHRLPAVETLEERIRDLYGEDMMPHLRPMNFGNGVVEINGYAGIPPFSRLDREWQVVFINGRPSGSPIINFAIQNAYRDVLSGGRYAPLFLYIHLPADLVDVNVHPAKKEVRFKRPTEVRDVIMEAIRMAIAGSAKSGAGGIPPPRSAAVQPPRMPPAQPQGQGGAPPPAIAAAVPPPPIWQEQQTFMNIPAPAPVAAAPSSAAPAVPEAPAVDSQESPWTEYRLLGRIGERYVAMETPDGLVLLDPRSAHERVLYERFLAALDKGGVPSQGLLPPAAVTLSPAQHAAVKSQAALLERLGFGLEEFSGDTWLVESLPVWLADVEAAPLLSDLADTLMQGAKPSAKDWAGPFLAALSSRAALAPRRELTDRELETLVRDLAAADMPYTSPSGKPTVVLISHRELNRKFGRE